MSGGLTAARVGGENMSAPASMSSETSRSATSRRIGARVLPLQPSPAGEVLSVAECARWLKVDRKTIYHAADRRQIPCARLGKRVLLLRDAIIAWLGGRVVAAPPPADDALTVDECARWLKVNRKTIYDAAKRRQIPCAPLGKRVVLSREAIVAWLGGRAP